MRLPLATIATSLIALALTAAPAGAALVDEFGDAFTPDFPDTTRTTSSPTNPIVIPLFNGALSYDGPAPASVIYTPDSPLSLGGWSGFALDYIQIADADNNAVSAALIIELTDGVNTATLTSILPYLPGTIFALTGDTLRQTYSFGDFTDIELLDLGAITEFSFTFASNPSQEPVIVAVDRISLIPTPGPLATGLVAVGILAAQRRPRRPRG